MIMASEFWIKNVPTCNHCKILKVSEPMLYLNGFPYRINNKGEPTCKECSILS